MEVKEKLVEKVLNGSIKSVSDNNGVKIDTDTLKNGIKLLDKSNPDFIKKLVDSLEKDEEKKKDK